MLVLLPTNSSQSDTLKVKSNGITRMLANGGKLDFVMKIAGHANPQTTLNYYVRSENFDLRDTVNLLSN